MKELPSSPSTPPGRPGELENALAYLQCVLVARRARATPERVSWQQYDVLEMLRIHGSMSPSGLSESLGVSRQTTSKALRTLKDADLIKQVPLGTDRREQTTSLTPAGREFMMRAAQSRRTTAEVASSALNSCEQRSFAALCQKVAEALHNSPQDFPLRDL